MRRRPDNYEKYFDWNCTYRLKEERGEREEEKNDKHVKI
jgi:hypothetical protein